MVLYAGAVVAGRYRLLHKIGSGGMGEVWAAEHAAIGVRVALKTLLPTAAADQQVVARFRREAYLLGRLRSDRVARVVDFVEDPEVGLVLVMDFVEGEPLANVLETRRLKVEEAIALGIDIVTALADLHRAKVVHRDLKPDNIILEPLDNGRTRAVIVDFGVSRMESSRGDPDGEEESITGITQADMAVGTIPYMAPEQFLSSRDVTGAADLYAVGAILFRALSGQHVYGDVDDVDYAKTKLTTRAPALPVQRFDRVGRGFSSIVAKALERVPDDRFATADEMRDALVALQDIARATALDLEAATEQALPPSSLVGEEVSEATRRISRPPGFSDDMLDERTLDSPMAGPPTETSPPPTIEPPSSALRSTLDSMPEKGAPKESTPAPSISRSTMLSAAVIEPASPRSQHGYTRRALSVAIAAALTGGFVMGFVVHWLVARGH